MLREGNRAFYCEVKSKLGEQDLLMEDGECISNGF